MGNRNESETIKQHFVPRVYLKNFGYKKNNEYYIKVLSKNQSSQNIFESNIKNICAENHFYTLDGVNLESRQLLENLYSKFFENNYPQLFDILINDNLFILTKEEKKSIISTIITMFFRTTKLINIMNDFNNECIKKVVETCNQFQLDYYIDSNGEKINIKEKTIQELKQDKKNKTRIPYILTQLRVALNLIELKQNDIINVFKIEDDSEFITSDNPVFAINANKGAVIPFHIDNIYYLPINNKYMLSIYPQKGSSENNVIIRIPAFKNQAIRMNKIQLSNCDRFIIGSKTGLEKTMKINV